MIVLVGAHEMTELKLGQLKVGSPRLLDLPNSVPVETEAILGHRVHDGVLVFIAEGDFEPVQYRNE